MVNDKVDENGEIKVRIVEGEGSNEIIGVYPHEIDKHEEVKNVDSKGNPLTTITLHRKSSVLELADLNYLLLKKNMD